MEKNEFGRSMIEMIVVLALIGILTIGGIMSYKNAQNQNEANKIQELVSIASLNGLTKMKPYNNSTIWNAIGKKLSDYKCVDSLSVESNGNVEITFSANCEKAKLILVNQWGTHTIGGGNSYTYIPPKDDE